MRTFREPISKEKAVDIALARVKKDYLGLFDEKKFKYMGAVEEGDMIIPEGPIYCNFLNTPYITIIDKGYIREWGKNKLTILLEKLFPKEPDLYWFIKLRFRIELEMVRNMYYDEFSDAKNAYVFAVINAETGEIKNIHKHFITEESLKKNHGY